VPGTYKSGEPLDLHQGYQPTLVQLILIVSLNWRAPMVAIGKAQFAAILLADWLLGSAPA